MTLLDELRAPLPTPPCKLGRLLSEKLTADEQADLDAALKMSDISNATFTRVLANREIVVKQETVREHRGGRCRCFR